MNTKPTVIEGQVTTWEDPIGCARASFAQGYSEVRAGLRWSEASLVIGDKAVPLSDHNAAVRDLAERLEEARRLLLAIATHSEQAGNDNVRGADLRLSTPSINAFLTRTKQPEE